MAVAITNPEQFRDHFPRVVKGRAHWIVAAEGADRTLRLMGALMAMGVTGLLKVSDDFVCGNVRLPDFGGTALFLVAVPKEKVAASDMRTMLSGAGLTIP